MTTDTPGLERFVAVPFPPEVDWLLALDATGRRLAVSWQDADHVRVFNVATGRVLARPREFQRVTGIAFLNSRELLVTAFGGCSRCALPRGGRVLLSKQGWQTCVAVAPDGGLVALGTDVGLSLSDLRTGQSHRLRAGNGFQYARRAFFSPGGRYVAAELGNEADRQPSLVAVWDTQTGRRQRIFDAEAHAIAFRGDTLGIALADDHGQILFYEPDEGEEPVRRLAIEKPWTYVPPRALQFRDEGRTLAALLWDGHFLLFDVASGRIVRHHPPPAGRSLRAAVASEDWAVFAAATEDGVVIWPGNSAGAETQA